MYKNFFNPKLIEVLFWIIEHDGEHSASLIYEETSLTQYTLVQYLHLLYTLDVCYVEEDKENQELFVSLNKESEIVKSIQNIQKTLDEKMNETCEVEMVLSQDNVKFIDLLDDLSQLDSNELLEICDELKEKASDDDMNIEELIDVLKIIGIEKKNVEEDE